MSQVPQDTKAEALLALSKEPFVLVAGPKTVYRLYTKCDDCLSPNQLREKRGDLNPIYLQETWTPQELPFFDTLFDETKNRYHIDHKAVFYLSIRHCGLVCPHIMADEILHVLTNTIENWITEGPKTPSKKEFFSARFLDMKTLVKILSKKDRNDYWPLWKNMPLDPSSLSDYYHMSQCNCFYKCACDYKSLRADEDMTPSAPTDSLAEATSTAP